MVEVSPKLSAIQKTKLAIESDRDNTKHDEDKLWYQHCKSKYGPDVYWYDHLRHVPCGYSFYIANEFFDALPIHIFQVSHFTALSLCISEPHLSEVFL